MDEILAERLRGLQARIAAACAAAGRDPRTVLVIAVTKGVAPELAAAACRLGLTDLGENRLQDALPRMQALAAQGLRPRWHFIGRLQANKAGKVAAAFATVDAVDSLALAERLDRAARGLGHRLPILLQVNTAEDPAKQGLRPAELPEVAAAVAGLPGLALEGLMTIGRLGAQGPELAAAFARLAELRQALRHRLPDLSLQRLSMGMSEDFESALAHGATELRIGSLLFGGLAAEAT